MTHSIAELKQLHQLAKPQLHQAIMNIQHILKMKDGEKALFALEHLLTAVQSYDEVGDILFVEIDSLQKKTEVQKELLLLSHYIMTFHKMRCPMNIDHNFSGHEEHLVMYRDVVKQLEPFKGEVDWDKWQEDWGNRLRAEAYKRKSERTAKASLSSAQEGEPHV